MVSAIRTPLEVSFCKDARLACLAHIDLFKVPLDRIALDLGVTGLTAALYLERPIWDLDFSFQMLNALGLPIEIHAKSPSTGITDQRQGSSIPEGFGNQELTRKTTG